MVMYVTEIDTKKNKIYTKVAIKLNHNLYIIGGAGL